MTNQHPRLTSVDSSEARTNANFWSFMPDLGGEQLATVAENACTWFHNRENIRQIQQQAAREAVSHHELISQKLREAKSPAEFMEIQQGMSRYYQDAVGQYWQQIATTHLQTQMEMMARVNQFLQGKASEQVSALLGTFRFSVPAGGMAEGDEQTQVSEQAPLHLASGKVLGR